MCLHSLIDISFDPNSYDMNNAFIDCKHWTEVGQWKKHEHNSNSKGEFMRKFNNMQLSFHKPYVVIIDISHSIVTTTDHYFLASQAINPGWELVDVIIT